MKRRSHRGATRTVVQALTPLSEQPEHQKVLAAGKPADAEPGDRHGLVRSMSYCG